MSFPRFSTRRGMTLHPTRRKGRNVVLALLSLIVLQLVVRSRVFDGDDGIIILATQQTDPQRTEQQLRGMHVSSKQEKSNARKQTKDAKFEPTYIDKSATQVILVGLISMQRSSSTYLSHQILGNQPCWVSLNEILQPDRQQSGDAWSVWPGTELKKGNWEAFESNPASQWAEFIVETGRRRCMEKWTEMTESPSTSVKEQCQNHCYITWKEFNHIVSPPKHKEIWTELHKRHDFYMLILERNIAQRWRSFWFAKKTNDWNIAGDKSHKEALAAIDNELPPMENKFLREHEDWYRMVRAFVSSSGAPYSLELNYDEVTQKKVGEMREIIRHFIQTAILLSKKS